MSEAIKPTRGPWELWGDADPSQVISSPAGFVAQTLGGNDQANAQLIAEAGTVAHTTGLTPRQLVERVWRLEEHLKLISNMPPTLARDDPQLAVRIAQDALSKSLPNTVAETQP